MKMDVVFEGISFQDLKEFIEYIDSELWYGKNQTMNIEINSNDNKIDAKINYMKGETI